MNSHSPPSTPPSIEQSGYFIAIGCNLQPGTNFPLILNQLIDAFGRFWLSAVACTRPVGMVSSNDFYNAVCFIPTSDPPQQLKAKLNRMEGALGRDRSDPERKIRDRPADLDILLRCEAHDPLDQRSIPVESYVGPLFRQLAGELGLLEVSGPLGLRTVSLRFATHDVGQVPVHVALGAPAPSEPGGVMVHPIIQPET